jgi:hypothetical protein
MDSTSREEQEKVLNTSQREGVDNQEMRTSTSIGQQQHVGVVGEVEKVEKEQQHQYVT